LRARLRALLRRESDQKSGSLQVADLKMDLHALRHAPNSPSI